MVGNSIEVKWEHEWWQAKIKKVKADKATDKIEKVRPSSSNTKPPQEVPSLRAQACVRGCVHVHACL